MNRVIKFFKRIFWMLHRPQPPEHLLNELVTRLRHDLTEARVQAAAAKLTAARTGPDLEQSDTTQRINELINRLEDAVKSAESQRLTLMAQLRAAEARAQVEKALLESDDLAGQPAYIVVESLVREAEARAAAINELNRGSGGNG